MCVQQILHPFGFLQERFDACATEISQTVTFWGFLVSLTIPELPVVGPHTTLTDSPLGPRFCCSYLTCFGDVGYIANEGQTYL